MKNLLHLVWLAPLALAAAACGDDSETGSGGSTGTSTAANGSTSTGAPTSTSTGNAPTSTAASSDGGGTGDGGNGGNGDGGDASGSGGATGVGGFEPGDAIDATPEEWTWVDFPDSRCMNDTPTGIGVNISATNTTDLVIFLQGGNACFNLASCAATAHANGFDEADFDSEIAEVGALPFFSRDGETPIADWSYAYVPYCTGDVHAGDNSANVGNKDRVFRGFRNMHDYLERLLPTFPNVTRVLLTGVSAGGFGAAYNYDQVKRAFGPDVDVVLVDDSGPPMAEEFVPACLQARFKDVWGLDRTLPANCDACRAGDTFTEEFLDYEFSTYPDSRFALISSTEDETIRTFWSFGNDDCANVDGLPGSYPGADYTAGLEDIRDRVGASANFALFMPDSDRHVWLNDAEGLATTVDGSPALIDWVAQVLDGDDAWQSWPEPQ